ncbi:fucolectin-like [Mercenaria mercenaria]|uniref:fucolectin-like n=1 Tax=Mercenaria mercenaria TaxID=6596 RepID=UPI00234E80E1|nr:fucolectin-like [Mercenaria mercenaria]XP_053379740.1 fucolectin-like [Mercenaria mercenaria]XP_053379741.1 fucolectin-like [Mercenaria mercenaria]
MEHTSIVILLVGFTLVGVLADVEDSCIVKNVALNKPAYVSSKHRQEALASLAVDGNLEQNYYGTEWGNDEWGKTPYCFHTQDIPSPNNWWYVDLQQMYSIEKMVFYNRIDCCSERAIFEIQVDYSSDNMTNVGFVEKMNSTKTVYMPTDTRGRYVKLVQPGISNLHLCEVEVYALPVCCSEPCQNGGTCSANNSDARGYECACVKTSDYKITGAHCEEVWMKLPTNRTYDLVPRP